MKKLITLLVTIAMIGVMLTGCGGSGKEVTADPAKLAEDLSKTASGDTLSSISEDILASTYLVDTSKIVPVLLTSVPVLLHAKLLSSNAATALMFQK